MSSGSVDDLSPTLNIHYLVSFRNELSSVSEYFQKLIPYLQGKDFFFFLLPSPPQVNQLLFAHACGSWSIAYNIIWCYL